MSEMLPRVPLPHRSSSPAPPASASNAAGSLSERMAGCEEPSDAINRDPGEDGHRSPSAEPAWLRDSGTDARRRRCKCPAMRSVNPLPRSRKMTFRSRTKTSTRSWSRCDKTSRAFPDDSASARLHEPAFRIRRQQSSYGVRAVDQFVGDHGRGNITEHDRRRHPDHDSCE